MRRLRDRIRQLEDENAQLRAELAAIHAPGPPLPRRGRDPWAVPDEGAAHPAAGARVEEPARAVAKGARFACRSCGELRAEEDLVRVDREFYCPSCVDRGGGDEPVTSGSYR